MRVRKASDLHVIAQVKEKKELLATCGGFSFSLKPQEDIPSLLQRVKDGLFREDLYYRLNVVTIDVPPLRKRPSDVPLLAMHFLKRYAEENGKTLNGFSDQALEQLAHYPWPGNVRELENAIERAVVVSRTDVIRAEDLSPPIASAARSDGGGLPMIPGSTLADIERFAILKTLEHTGGSTSRAAELLGISTRKIQYKLHDFQNNGSGQKSGDSGDTDDNDPNHPVR
jgi:DNA-binding NtrC family response regulator